MRSSAAIGVALASLVGRFRNAAAFRRALTRPRRFAADRPAIGGELAFPPRLRRSPHGRPLRGHRGTRFLGFLGIASLALGACSGGEESAAPPPPVPAAAEQAVPQALLEKAWQVRMADAAARAPFEAHPGWGAVFAREYDRAITAFGADRGNGRGLARAHLEYAAVYREAARLAAHSTREVYGADRQEADPREVPYLVGVSAALLGDCTEARESLDRATVAADSSLAPPLAAWKGWAAGCPAPLPAFEGTGFPGAPGAVEPGTVPLVGELPHYRLAEANAEAREVEAGDPTSLLLVSRWHEEAARRAAPPEDADAVAVLLALSSLPSEPAPSPSTPALADEWLFASFLLSAEDAPFLVAARSGGAAAVAEWKDRSALAAVVAPAIADEKVVVDKMLDQSAWLGKQVEAAMAAKAGQEEGFHRAFADLARVAALRAGMVVADGAGQYRDAGILRVNALERSIGPAADPVFLASVAAWDAGNRNALRAQDLLHRLIGPFPGLAVARYPLDALQIRLGRNAAPATPVH